MMRYIDRILFGVASLSLLSVVAILAAGEISPKYISSNAFHSAGRANEESALVEVTHFENIADHSAERQGEPEAVETDIETTIEPQEDADHSAEGHSGEDIIVLSREIDNAIESYFESIRQHPEKLEEEDRLVTEEPDQDTENSENNESNQTKNFQMVQHTVSKGESVWRIANSYNVPVYTIVSANPGKASRIIQPGDKLSIPNQAGVMHKIKKGETLAGIAKKFKTDSDKIQELNNIAGTTLIAGETLFIPGAKPLPETIYVNRKRFIWPVSGRLTSRFGWRKHPIYKSSNYHPGIDIGASWGTPIKAAASGVVVFAGNGGGYGNMVILKHKDGYFTVYAHASKIEVKRGSYVKQGQRIGRVGSTGLSTGSHLHFEVKRNRKVVNPLTALKETVKIAQKAN